VSETFGHSTPRPYFDDPYTTTFETTVADERRDARGLWLALAASYFYPTGGGQECDLGTLGRAAVVDVEEDEAGRVWHLVSGSAPSPGEPVVATIDAGRRQANRQQHTGQHVLSQAFERVLGAFTVSSRLGEFEGTIDLDRADLTWDDVERVEEAANAVVFDDRPVQSLIVQPSELGDYPLRKPPKVDGPVRLIVVPGWDVSPCGGTHVTRTGEIGPIKVRRWEKWKGGVRVEFVCGLRALADYQDRTRALVDAALRQHTSDRDVIDVLERAAAERAQVLKQVRRLGEQLALAEARSWGLSRAASGSAHGWARFLDERDPAALKALATAAVAQGAPLVVVAASAPEPALVLARARELPEPDLKSFAAELRELAAGKGGGGADLLTIVARDALTLRAAYERALALTGAVEDKA
jgi:alanyl-tRNA synthetase